ncbi:PREDICTED: cell wall protein RBR3-like [Trachymyrmex cornetzi]|uniref:cell wall protein RBR3-like n=1 Tax=Trachymyrmex cornetzi TaxID=471704 RepID=UPI00084EF850|nr:PREDICTED: cell wall protein RBR3-like [Trachymyrmex cornetzi]
MFLVDHIQPRQTTSNYRHSKPIHNKASNLLNSLASQRLISTPCTSSQSNSVSNSLASQRFISILPRTSSQNNSVSNPLASQQLISTPPCTSSQNNSVLNSLASQQLISTPPCTLSQSNSDNSSDVLNMFEFFTESSSKDEEVFSKVNSKDSSSTLDPSNLSILSDNASASVLKAAVSKIVPKKQTPPSDIKKRKRGLTDEEDAIMLQSSKNISSLANTLETVLKNPTSKQLAVSEVTSEVQTMIGPIALGLNKVPMEYQMDCLIHILSSINDFAKKKS